MTTQPEFDNSEVLYIYITSFLGVTYFDRLIRECSTSLLTGDILHTENMYLNLQTCLTDIEEGNGGEEQV